MHITHVQHRGVKADWAAKITGHCSGEAASDGRPHHQDATWTTSQSCCHGLLVEVAGNEVGQQRHGGPQSKKTLWTEESIGTASGLWLQTGTDGELLLPIV